MRSGDQPVLASAQVRAVRTDVVMTMTRSTSSAPSNRGSKQEKQPPAGGRPSVGELEEWDIPTDRLWKLEDIAAFLRFSVRFTEGFVKEPTVPQPCLVSRGGDRRWSGPQWLRWADSGDTHFLADVPDLEDSDAEMAVI